MRTACFRIGEQCENKFFTREFAPAAQISQVEKKVWLLT